LMPGTMIKTPGYKLKIICCAGKGNTGAVYKAETVKGEHMVVGLKVCVKYEPEVLISMQRESKKMAFLAELRVCNFTAILEAGDDYAVKEWAEGITGVEWFRMWEAQGAKTADESFRKLIQLFYQIAEKKIYLQNFKPHNLLWDQKQQIWHVIDYGGHKAMSSSEVVQKYYFKFDEMWNKNKKLVPPCVELVRRMEEEEGLEKKLERMLRTESTPASPQSVPSPDSANGKTKISESPDQIPRNQQRQKVEEHQDCKIRKGKKEKKGTLKESTEKSKDADSEMENEENENTGNHGTGEDGGVKKKVSSLLILKPSKSKKTKKK